MKNVARILALALAVVMTLVSCGGPAATTTPGATATGTPENKPTIVVGYTLYEPMNYMDENNQLVGFDTELAEKVFSNLGYTVVFKEIKWESKYTDLKTGAIDCIWNGFTSNGSDDGTPRAELVDFSYNYMENRQVVVVKKDAGITDAAGLSGKIGYVEAESAGAAYAASFEGALVNTAITQTDALKAVLTNSATFAVLDAQLAKSLVGKGDFESLTIIDSLSSDVEYYAIGFEKGSELTAKVNAELEKLAADGTLMAIATKYEVQNTVVTDFADQKK